MDPADPAKQDALTRLQADQHALTQQLEALRARLEEQNRQWPGQEAHPPEAPEAIRARMKAEAATTPADLQHMLGRDTYPTWIHAAYADLAGRLARVEDLLEELDASMSLLHTKMETIIGQLVADERQDRAE